MHKAAYAAGKEVNELLMTSAQTEKRQLILCEKLKEANVRYELFADSTENSEYPYSFGISVKCGELEARIADITENSEYARELFERIMLYTVMPSELEYIVEDFLCEKYTV